MSLKKFLLFTLGTTLSLLPTLPASALVWSLSDSDNPNTGSNTLSNLGFVMQAVSSSGANDGDPVDYLYTANGQGLGFTPSFTKQTVGSAWLTWSHSYTGEVFVNDSDTATLNVDNESDPTPITAIGFYLQPQAINSYNIAVSVNGLSPLIQSVSGSAGAKYFGFYATDGDQINSISISAPSSALGFATGEYSLSSSAVAVPFEFDPTLGISVGLTTWFSLSWVRRKKLLKTK